MDASSNLGSISKQEAVQHLPEALSYGFPAADDGRDLMTVRLLEV